MNFSQCVILPWHTDALGQSRTSDDDRLMSVEPLIADSCRTSQHVAEGPFAIFRAAAIPPLLDHVIGSRQQSWRYSESERLGSL